MHRAVFVTFLFLGGCGEVIKEQCPAAQDCNGTCCAANESCVAGACSACPADQLSCNGTCLDGTSDPLNCGDCGVTCGTTATCSNSACNACPMNQTACDNMCVDTQNDAANCGMCGKTCDPGLSCIEGACVGGFYELTGTPSPDTVFNTIAETYKFGNNLTNSIWQRESNMILTGEFSTAGYWAFAPATATYASAPDHDTVAGIHARMVLIPTTDTVVYSNSPSQNGVGVATSAQFAVASISRTTGLLGTPQTAVFSDGFAAGCLMTSASARHFLCYDGTGIRRYTTTAGSPTLTYVDTIALSTALPTPAQCAPNTACYGSTFAFDGAYYYFAGDEGISTNLSYLVYSATGQFMQSYTASAGGSINGVYFDWSVGRYSTHDGFGGRTGTTAYGTGSDTHNFGPISTAHTLR